MQSSELAEKYSKNHMHVKKVGHTSEFFLAFIDELDKQLFI